MEKATQSQIRVKKEIEGLENDLRQSQQQVRLLFL